MSQVRVPPVLDSALLLEYVVLDQRVGFSGHTNLFVDGKELGRVPVLALCRSLSTEDLLLFYCRKDWSVIGVTSYSSTEEAKSRAERIFPGSLTLWLPGGATREQALAREKSVPSADACPTKSIIW